MTRIVLDTNVFISAVIRKGKPRCLLESGIDGDYTIVISNEILDEISLVLIRPKFKITEEEVRRITNGIMESSEMVSVKSKFKIIKNDPDDDIIINTAYDGKADYIVSGDDDLLELGDFHGIKIVTVDRMLAILKK